MTGFDVDGTTRFRDRPVKVEVIEERIRSNSA